jgi:hypothetical protein
VTSLRRFAVLQLLMLWQGGFLFYTSVVVPLGTQLNGPTGQGAVTARVTEWLNLIGAVALAALALDLAFARDPNRRRTACRWWTWFVAFACQYLLFFFHACLDHFMDDARRRVVVREAFYPAHRAYLWVSTVQWLAGLLLAWWSVRAWRAEDRGA